MQARDVRIADTDFAQPFEALVVGAAAAHHTDVADAPGERAADRGDVELRVVGEHAHRVARTEVAADPVEQLVRPGDDELVGHRESFRRGEHLARVAHGDVVAEHLGDAGESGGEVDGSEDDHPRRRSERLDEHAHDGLTDEVGRRRFAARTVAAHDVASGVEFAECVAGRHPIEFVVAEGPLRRAVGVDE